ncbi:MAG TPA: 6-bladed beta-propeller [Flavisolibacter sp.]|nr:6-bladed beta-propeller [Flavisolibacter sp.]
MRICLLYCTSLLLYFLLISTNVHSQLQKIYLHPKAPGSEKQSQVVDSIRFIPLEIKEGVDVSGFNTVTVTANYFLIINYSASTILVYHKNGAFVNKISYKKLGQRFYPAYDEKTNHLVFFGANQNYSLTSKDQIQIMLDWNNPRNKKYFRKYAIDLADPEFSIQKSSPNENDILRANHCYDDYYWSGQITTSDLFKDSMDYELKIYKDNALVKAFFPYNRITEPKYIFTRASVSLNSTNNPDIHLVTRPFCDTIYRMVKNSMAPAYHLVLPMENSLPASFHTQPFKNKTERENFERNNGWMFRQVYSIYETPRLIFLSVGYLSNHETYLYQKQTNTTYKAKNIRTDSSQYNLALLADKDIERYGLERKGDRFYKTQKAGDLLAFFEKNKSVAVPKELETFLNSKPNSNAPVIVEFKLKN